MANSFVSRFRCYTTLGDTTVTDADLSQGCAMVRGLFTLRTHHGLSQGNLGSPQASSN
jgi:hypothetical protein